MDDDTSTRRAKERQFTLLRLLGWITLAGVTFAVSSYVGALAVSWTCMVLLIYRRPRAATIGALAGAIAAVAYLYAEQISPADPPGVKDLTGCAFLGATAGFCMAEVQGIAAG